MLPDPTISLPPDWLIRASVAAVWLYEGFWCKLLGRAAQQLEVVGAVPFLADALASRVLFLLGMVEVGLAIWVLSGYRPGLCAIAQTALLVGMNSAGIFWARHKIHDPAGMVLKNAAFLMLAWVGAASQKVPLDGWPR
jgi:hypothetical protein